MSAGRKPDYRVKAMRKDNSLKGDVGAAWANDDGSISVVINPFVKLEQDGNLVVTLFKIEPYKPKET